MSYKIKLTNTTAGTGRLYKMEQEIELKAEDILANDVTFSNEFNPHNIGLWVIGHEYGAICAVWGHDYDVLDVGVDEGKLDCFLIEEEDIDEEMMKKGEYACLGNASEPANLDYCWLSEVELEKQDLKLLLAFAEARGGCYDTLDF